MLGRELDHLVRQLNDDRLSRRLFIQRALQLGLSLGVAQALLAACGSAATPAPGAGSSSAPASASGSGATPAASGQAGSAGKPGGTLTFGVNQEIDNLDPAVTPFAVSYTIMMNIYDPLIWRANDGKFVAGLAESWASNTEGTEYTFKLRKDVKFHDGTPFNAEAVKFNLDHVVNPETKSGFAISLLGPYDRTEVVDEFTAKVVMKAPFAPLLDGLSQAFLGMSSPKAVQEKGKAYGRSPVGTGWMKFVEWVEKDHITLSRNPDYKWGPAFFAHTGPAFLEKITYRFYPEDPTRLAALESSDAQMITPIPPSNVKRFQDDKKYQVLIHYNPGIPSVLQLNTSKAPTNDLAVRKAMNYGLDRKKLMELVTFGTAKESSGPLGENTPFYSKEAGTLYAFDLEKAKQTLQDAGWVPGSDGIRAKNGQKLTMTFAASPLTAAVAEAIQVQFRPLGIDLQLVQGTSAATTESMVRGDNNMALISWVSSDPVVLTTVFHSKNTKTGFGWHKYADPKLDELLDAGERTRDEAKRTDVYTQAQKIIMEQALVLPLYQAANSVGVEAKYKDVKRDFRNYVWLYDVYVG